MDLTSDASTNITLVYNAARNIFGQSSPLTALCVSQAILESNLLHHPSELALKYNNLFGIKGTGTHGSITLMTHEFQNGHMEEIPQKFAANLYLQDSIRQYRTLLSLPRYVSVVKAKTFEDAAREIKSAGYSTDPDYTNLLIKVYQNNVKPWIKNSGIGE